MKVMTVFSALIFLSCFQLLAAERSKQEVEALSACPVKEMIRLDRGEDATVLNAPRNQAGAMNCFAQTASCMVEGWMWKNNGSKQKNSKIEDYEVSTMVATIDGLVYGIKKHTEDNESDDLDVKHAKKFNVNGGGSICDVVNAFSQKGSYCPRHANIYEANLKTGKTPDQDLNQVQKKFFDFLQAVLSIQMDLEDATNRVDSVVIPKESLKTLQMLKEMFLKLVKEISEGKSESEIRVALKNELYQLNQKHKDTNCDYTDAKEKELISQVNDMITFANQDTVSGNSKELFTNFIKSMADKTPLESLPDLMRALVAPKCLNKENEIKINPKPFCEETLTSQLVGLNYKDSEKLYEKSKYFEELARTQYQTLKSKIKVTEAQYVQNFVRKKYSEYYQNLMNTSAEKVYLKRMPVTEKLNNSDSVAKAMRAKILPSITGSKKLPVGIGYCSGILFNRWLDTRGLPQSCEKKDGHGPHASAIIGVRPNQNGQGCQYLIRNSFSMAGQMDGYNENERRKVCGEWVQYEKRKNYSVQKSKSKEQIQAERDKLDCDNGNLWIDESALLSNTYSISVMTRGYEVKSKVQRLIDKNE